MSNVHGQTCVLPEMPGLFGQDLRRSTVDV